MLYGSAGQLPPNRQRSAWNELHACTRPRSIVVIGLLARRDFLGDDGLDSPSE
jgi:hypothetical protein